MSDPVFVIDAHAQPLMPLSAAHARRLITRGKARWLSNPSFPVIQLDYVVEHPQLRPLILAIAIKLKRADCWLVAEGNQRTFALAHVIIDLHTDLSGRIRRRAEHRRRRRARRRTTTASEIVNYRHRSQLAWQGTPLLQWRVQAIQRVIAKLQVLMPISHVLLTEPRRSPFKHWQDLSMADRHQIISKRDGNQCAYCGQTEDNLELDHVLPRSRGGTDSLTNLVLACHQCNGYKGDRTPDEAGMNLHPQIKFSHLWRRREQAQVYQMAQLLYRHLPASLLTVIWQHAGATEKLLSDGVVTTLDNWNIIGRRVGQWVAKPIARLRQQRFYARNYPLSTPTNTAFIKMGTTIKRRVAVNRSLAVWHLTKLKTRVIKTTDPEPADATFHIRRGMVCEVHQSKQRIRGIVGAIHSSGRITLLVPSLDKEEIVWKRVAATVRSTLHVVSHDGVAFLRIARQSTE